MAIGSYKGTSINPGTDQEVAAQVAAIDGRQTTAPTTPAPSIADAYSTANIALGDTSKEDRAYQRRGRQLERDSASVNENSIFRDTMKRFQAEIDATNNIYAQKLADQKQVGIGNLGSSRAVQARSGLLGSDFGLSQTSGVQSQNLAQEDLVRQEQSAKIAAILGKGRTAAAEELAAKRAAQQASAKDYIDFLGSAADRKAKKSSGLAEQFLDQDVDPDKIDPGELARIAKQSGLQVSDITSNYRSLKLSREKAAQEARQKAIKDNSFSLSEGQSRYTYNPDTGAYDLTASKAKTYAPSSGGGGVGASTPGGITDASGRRIKLTAGQVDTISAFENTIGASNDALALLRKGTQTGPLANVLLQGAKFTGGADADQLQLEQVLSKVKADFMKALSGAAVSEQEAKRLSRFLPDVGDQEDVLESKLKNLINETQRSRANFISTLGGTQNSATPSASPVGEVEEVLIEVISPEGIEGTVPQSELQDYINQGYTPI